MGTQDPKALEARERDLNRVVLSLICRSSGRRRTPDETRDLDALVGEIHHVRTARREAARPVGVSETRGADAPR